MSIFAWSCHQHQGGRFQRSKVSSVDTQLESLPKISHQIEDSIWGSWHPNRGMVRFIWCQVDRIWLACPREILSVANTYKLRFLLLCCSLSRWHQGQKSQSDSCFTCYWDRPLSQQPAQCQSTKAWKVNPPDTLCFSTCEFWAPQRHKSAQRQRQHPEGQTHSINV